MSENMEAKRMSPPPPPKMSYNFANGNLAGIPLRVESDEFKFNMQTVFQNTMKRHTVTVIPNLNRIPREDIVDAI